MVPAFVLSSQGLDAALSNRLSTWRVQTNEYGPLIISAADELLVADHPVALRNSLTQLTDVLVSGCT